MAGFSEVKETNFFSFYELDVEEKVIFETSLRRKLRLETGISTVFRMLKHPSPEKTANWRWENFGQIAVHGP